MKTANDPRHKNRIKRMEALFSLSFENKKNVSSIADIMSHLDEIDTIIKTHAPEWPIDKLSKIDLAILRLAVYELRYEPETPEKVVIDEAIELSKAYGNEHSPKFINGALGSIIKK